MALRVASLRRSDSVESFDTAYSDTVSAIRGLRSEGLIGTVENDPILAYQNARIEQGYNSFKLALERYKDQQASPSLFNLLAGLFKLKRREYNYNYYKQRSTRDFKDARKTLTRDLKNASLDRAKVLAVCQFAFGEVYVRELDEGGSRNILRLFAEQLEFPESSKEYLYVRSRLLRHLSLRVMSVSGLFSVYHTPGKAEEMMKVLDQNQRSTIIQMKSKLGALPEYKEITNKIMKLLNDTILVNRELRYSTRIRSLIEIAEGCVARYNAFMQLPKSQRAIADDERIPIDKSLATWQTELNNLRDFFENIGGEKQGIDALVLHSSQSWQEDQDRYALWKELLAELNLSVLFKGTPDSLGIRRLKREVGTFGTVDKYLLSEPMKFSSVPWTVSELAVKTIYVTSHSSRRDETSVQRHFTRVIRELRVWCKMRHENIVPILGVWDTQEQDAVFCTVAPWVSDGQLDHYMSAMSPGRSEALELMRDIASALTAVFKIPEKSRVVTTFQHERP